MMYYLTKSNRAVTFFFTICVFVLISGFVFADETEELSKLDQLFVELADPAQTDAEGVEKKIWREWSKSGSDAMDFLLKRGHKAMEAGDVQGAIWHFSALIDHAPTFAEGWNARATAFFMAEEYGLSMADIQQVLVLNPRHFGALGGLGEILYRIDRKEEALKAYEQAFDLHPHSEKLKQAVEALEKELEGTPL